MRGRGTKQAESAEIDLTPMLDVVFILLIFFIVTARMEPTIVAELPKAKNGDVAAGEEGVVVNVKQGADGKVEVIRSNGVAFASDPDQMATEVEEYVRNAVENEQRKFVLIRGEPAVKTREMTRVRVAASAGLNEDQQILIAVQQ